MKKLIVVCFAFSIFSQEIFSQSIGSRNNSDIAPGTTVSPAKLTGGGLVGDVNVFNGSYSTSYPLGSVSTPGGLSFSLNLSYSATYSTSNTVPVSTGIPYGEGWNLNIPTISVMTDIYNKYLVEECLLAGTEEHLKKVANDEKYYFSPYINIPGVASGTAVFKFAELKDGLKKVVFSLNTFESYVEIIYDGFSFEVITSDGTQYKFNVVQRNFRAGSNKRSVSEQGLFENPDFVSGANDVVMPNLDLTSWHCTEITHPNKPFFHSIFFTYKLFGGFDFFQEFQHVPNKGSLITYPSFTVYTDVLLQKVESRVGDAYVDIIDLEYETQHPDNTIGMLRLGDNGVAAHDEMYNMKTVYRSSDINRSNWKRFYHVKSDRARVLNDYQEINFGSPSNPYMGTDGSETRETVNSYYIGETIGNNNSFTRFEHGFIETDRITSGLVAGDTYELKTYIAGSNIAATVDINIVTGKGSHQDFYDNKIYKEAYEKYRSTNIFNTFGQAIKWAASSASSTTSNIRSNIFVMPQIPSNYGGINIQFGLGNSDTEYLQDMTDLVGTSYNVNFTEYDEPRAANNYFFKRNPDKRKGQAPSYNFGLGMPWSMVFNQYSKALLFEEDKYARMLFWWKPLNSLLQYTNKPTLDFNAGIGSVELVRYSKNPYMLTRVKHYKASGELDTRVRNSDRQLVNQLNFHYDVQVHNTELREYILDGDNSHTVVQSPSGNVYKTNYFLLSKIEQEAIDPTKYLSEKEQNGLQVPNTVPSLPVTKFYYNALDGYAEDVLGNIGLISRRKGVVLVKTEDQLGGETEIEYYPTYFSTMAVRSSPTPRCTGSSIGSISQELLDLSMKSISLDVTPLVKQVTKVDAPSLDLAKSANPLPKVTTYEYDLKLSKREHLVTNGNSFRRTYIGNAQRGFRKTKVILPEVEPNVRPYTVYVHHGAGLLGAVKDGEYVETYKSLNTTMFQLQIQQLAGVKSYYEVTYGDDFKYQEDPVNFEIIMTYPKYALNYDYGGLSEEQAYLYFGKINSITEYTSDGRKVKETLINYGHTLAFKHGMSEYTYNTNGGLHDDAATDYQSGRDELRIGGNSFGFPLPLDAYFYDNITGLNNSNVPLNPDYKLNSYFVKKTKERLRTYDNGVLITKSSSTNGGGTKNDRIHKVRNAPELGRENPGNGGHKNDMPSSDLPIVTDIINNNPVNRATQNIKELGQISDVSLEHVISRTSKLGSGNVKDILIHQPRLTDRIQEKTLQNTSITAQHKEDILIAQPYLTENILSNIVVICPMFPSAAVERVAKKQPWSNERVLGKVIDNDKIMNDHLQGVFMHQPYALSQEMLVKYIDRQPNLSEQSIKEFLLKQPVIGDEPTRAILRKEPRVNSKTLFEVIAYSEEFPSDDVFNEVIASEILTPIDLEGLLDIKPSPITEEQLQTKLNIDKYNHALEEGLGNAACNGSEIFALKYIENVTDYEYFEANYLGIPTSSAILQFGVPDISFEPSWQLYRTKSYSPQLPGVYSETKQFYYYDLRNLSFNKYSGDDDMVYKFNLRNLSFQTINNTKNNRDKELQRSEFTIYDKSRYNSASVGYATYTNQEFAGPPCPTPEQPDPIETALESCRQVKYFGEDHNTFLLGQMASGECAIQETEGTKRTYSCPSYVALKLERYQEEKFEILLCKDFEPYDPEVQLHMGFDRFYFEPLYTAVQIDTVQQRTDPRVEPNYELISFDINGKPVFPFEVLVTNKINQRNVYGMVLEQEDVNGIKTRYEYPLTKRNYYRDPNCWLNNYITVTNPGFMPTKVTVGYEREDALVNQYEYYPTYHLKAATTPIGVIYDYRYDKIGRLYEMYENNRLLSTNRYNYWAGNSDDSFRARATQNFVKSYTYTNEGDYENAELVTSFIDPLGRAYNTTWQHNYDGANPLSQNATHSAGQAVYDSWDRTVKAYKPFSVNYSSDQPLLNEQIATSNNFTSLVKYEPNQHSRGLISAKPGQVLSGTRNVKSTYAIINHLKLTCELDLTSDEERLMYSNSPTGYYFTRVETTDEDGKKVVEYANAMGQKVATKQLLEGTLSGVVTLFFYDSYHNLTKVINPKKQQSNYKYNILGNLYQKTTGDDGTTNYMYNKRGQVVLVEDENSRYGESDNLLQMESVGYYYGDYLSGIPKTMPYFRYYLYDDYGRLLEQNRINAGVDCIEVVGGVAGGAQRTPGDGTVIIEDPDLGENIEDYLTDDYGNWFVKNINVVCQTAGVYSSYLEYSFIPLLNYKNHNTTEEEVNANANSTNFYGYVFTNKSSMEFAAGITIWGYGWIGATGSPQVRPFKMSIGSLAKNLPALNEKTWHYNNQGQLEEVKSFDDTPFYKLKESSFEHKPIEVCQYQYDDLGRIFSANKQFNPYGVGNSPEHLVSSGSVIQNYNLRGSPLLEAVSFASIDKTQTLLYRYTYDIFNQLRAIEAKQLADVNFTKVVEYDYDDALKLLTKKRTYATDENGVAYLADETIYTYDERDRLTNMEGQLYGNRLYYDAQTLIGVNQSQNYNGNINAVSHHYKLAALNTNYTSGQGFDTPTHYGYRYDGINRMVEADANLGSGYSNKLGDATYVYDIIGNITVLNRNEAGANQNASVLRNLKYTYQPDNNRLLKVSGFENNESRVYTYDANGNLTTNAHYGSNDRIISDRPNTILGNTNYGRGNYAFQLKLKQINSYNSENLDDEAIETFTEVNYLYNDQDQRIYKRSGNGERNFIPATGEITSENKTITAEEYYVTNAMGQTVAVMDLFNNQATWYINGHDRVAKLTLSGGDTPGRPTTPTGVLKIKPIPILAGVTVFNALRNNLDKDEFGKQTILAKILKRELLPFVAGVLAAKATNVILNANEETNSENESESTAENTGNTTPLTLSYYVNDYLGNTRMVFTPNIELDPNTNVTTISYNIETLMDYYPYGKVLRQWGSQEKYLTTQHERDTETNFDYRGARYYDSDIGRFLSLEPKAMEYPSLSHYNYVAGNPIFFVDPDGKEFIKKSDERKAQKYEKVINKRIQELNTQLSSASDVEIKNEISLKLLDLNSAKNEIQSMRESEVGFTFGNSFFGDAKTFYSSRLSDKYDKDVIKMTSSDIFSFAHEAKHGYQYIAGETSFKTKGKGAGYLHDLHDEAAAYKREFALGNTKAPLDSKELKMSGITPDKVPTISEKYSGFSLSNLSVFNVLGTSTDHYLQNEKYYVPK